MTDLFIHNACLTIWWLLYTNSLVVEHGPTAAADLSTAWLRHANDDDPTTLYTLVAGLTHLTTTLALSPAADGTDSFIAACERAFALPDGTYRTWASSQLHKHISDQGWN